MERSEIRVGVGLVPDVASLIRATKGTVKPGDDDQNQKGGRRARRLIKLFPKCWVPGRSEAPPGHEGYFLDFFFDFDFFAFFAFFAFLAIVSSQGLMDGNATRG